jgi:hypothetical protein
MNEEGPVAFPLLCRRVIQAWGMNRAGGRIEERLQSLCSRTRGRTTRVGRTVFYWPEGMYPEAYEGFRVPGSDADSLRKPEELPVEEIANAARAVLNDQISLPEADLIREVARLFGYARTGAHVEQALRPGVALLVQRDQARRTDDGRIVGVE